MKFIEGAIDESLEKDTDAGIGVFSGVRADGAGFGRESVCFGEWETVG